MPAVTDLRDTRVLIPRMRRTLDGPHAIGSAAPSNTLTDDEVNNTVADAIASVIFYSGGLFGKTLEVVARDSYYMAPIAWQTSEALTDPEVTVICAQAALDYFHQSLVTLQTSSTIRAEGREWSYTLSASAVAERIRELKSLRNEAIAKLEQSLVAEDWINTLAVRDAWTDRLIEPFLYGIGGQEVAPPWVW